MRRLLLSLTLALTLSAVGAGSALAELPEGAQTAPLYGPFSSSGGIFCDTGALPTPETFGFVVLNTPGGDTTLTGEVALKHAAPNTTYVVEIIGAEVAPPHGCVTNFPLIGDITTNKNGNGNLHFTTDRRTVANKFFVTVEHENTLTLSKEVFISPTVELD
jgi:hypothetical protein